MSRDTPARIRGLAVLAECLAGGWLAEISADLREAVARALEACSRRCALQSHCLLYVVLIIINAVNERQLNVINSRATTSTTIACLFRSHCVLYCAIFGWLRGTVLECRSLTSELSLSCA